MANMCNVVGCSENATQYVSFEGVDKHVRDSISLEGRYCKGHSVEVLGSIIRRIEGNG